MRSARKRTVAVGGLATMVLVLAGALGLSTAVAAGSPWWHLDSSIRPSNLAPGGEGTLTVIATNLGDGPTSGPITLRDVLPAGLAVVEKENGSAEMVPQVSFFAFSAGKKDLGNGSFFAFFKACEAVTGTVSCATTNIPPIAELVGSHWPAMEPYEDLEMLITVKNTGTVLAPNKVEVAGGETAPATVSRPVPLSNTLTAFGAERFTLVPENEDGEVDVQAGSHPFQLTTTFALNQTADPIRPPALPRNLQFTLPPGLVGNAAAISRCSDTQFRDIEGGGFANACPSSSVVGVAVLTIDEGTASGYGTFPVPLFNLDPSKGEPARFGFAIIGSPVTLDTSVRTGSDYGVTVSVSNITQLTSFINSVVTFWGVPGDPRHDRSRGWNCIASGRYGTGTCEPSAASNTPPFLTLPTSCASPFTPSVEGVSWPTKAAPSGFSFPREEYQLSDGFGRTLGMTGCNVLSFAPTVEVAPDVQAASTPTGLKVSIHVPQEISENPAGLSSSDVRDITVALPEGVTVNPAAADGLQACSEAQLGYEPLNSSPPGDLRFSADLPEPLLQGVNFCADAAKIGTVKITTPLLPKGQAVEGSVYLGAPAPNGEEGKNPFDTLVALYIVARDPISGVLVKLPGSVALDPTTGRLTTTFQSNPELPFEDAELHLFGGSRAPLATPARCGSYTTDASFTPWSGNEPVPSSSTFQITSGPGGSPCPGTALPFAPTLAAGTTNINAAAFSPLTTTIGREDGNQDIQTVQLHMPPGLSGVLAGVPLCPEAQANAGTCSQASRIGSTIVSVGLGNEPFSVTGGEVFLTEKYAGAPFGLSIVNPAKAGPFDLGKVIVRASIKVDPTTAELTITTGQIPHILKGIPLQIKHVSVTIDRPGFTFNPTNCNPMAITGTIGSIEGASSPVSVPFQVTNCASLRFAPKFQVSTSGKTSKANGASLNVRLSYPSAPQGSQANIARVKVDLPKQLPSRLTTLQKACTSAQFNANPAGCPVASRIGFVTVTTPLLPVPLTGPAIFVSHGGEAFPSLTMVLQGYGVSVDLVGSTFISKAGITSTTFKTIPDVPFSTFMLTLPQGKFSALAANGNLCKSSLVMPTSFVAQNGLVARQATKVAVTGCAKHKTKKAKKRRGARRGQHKPAKK